MCEACGGDCQLCYREEVLRQLDLAVEYATKRRQDDLIMFMKDQKPVDNKPAVNIKCTPSIFNVDNLGQINRL